MTEDVVLQEDFGKFYLSNLQQDVFWQDIYGVRWPIEIMEADYISNCVAYLERNAERFYLRLLQRLPSKYPGDVIDLDDAEEESVALEWIRSSPLYQKLTQEYESKVRTPDGRWDLS